MIGTVRAAFAVLAFSGLCVLRADQLAVLPARDAERVRTLLLTEVQAGGGTGTLVQFCSLCDDDLPTVWHYADVRTVEFRRAARVLFTLFGREVTAPRLTRWRTVEILGRPVLRAGTNVVTAGVAHPAGWRETDEPGLRWEELDFAYVYCGTGSVLSCAAVELRWPCNLTATSLAMRAADAADRK